MICFGNNDLEILNSIGNQNEFNILVSFPKLCKRHARVIAVVEKAIDEMCVCPMFKCYARFLFSRTDGCDGGAADSVRQDRLPLTSVRQLGCFYRVSDASFSGNLLISFLAHISLVRVSFF